MKGGEEVGGLTHEIGRGLGIKDTGGVDIEAGGAIPETGNRQIW